MTQDKDVIWEEKQLARQEQKHLFDFKDNKDNQFFAILNSNIQKCRRCDISDSNVNRTECGECFGKLIMNHENIKENSKKFLFVGLAPSYRRFDKELRAFRGVDNEATLEKFKTSGDLFRVCLKEANLLEYDIYITNIVKCSTKENELPSPLNIVECFKWFNKEIEFLKPTLVVCMGTTVDTVLYKHLTNYTKTKIWHPSYCLRDRSKIKDFIKQLNNLKEMLK